MTLGSLSASIANARLAKFAVDRQREIAQREVIVGTKVPTTFYLNAYSRPDGSIIVGSTRFIDADFAHNAGRMTAGYGTAYAYRIHVTMKEPRS